ncbi:MAG TPA: NADH-quinone oxidoreductase subunit A [Planctomycetota bacterium]|jgi:NADH-quinone oxidoreductase subunit A
MNNAAVEVFAATLYILLAVGLGVGLLAFANFATYWLGLAKRKQGKYATYECGVPLLGSTRERFSVKFYLVALMFVLFDIETVFLVPYAVAYKKLGVDGFLAVLAFVVVLGLGLLYILKRNALEWD